MTTATRRVPLAAGPRHLRRRAGSVNEHQTKEMEMKAGEANERYTLTLKFEVAAPTQTAARTMGLRISSDLVRRYELARAPMLKVQPARQPVGA